MPSAGMLTELSTNVTWLCPVWRMTSAGGTVAAYAMHTRDLVYDGVTYKSVSIEPSRPSRKIGFDPDSAELTGVFDAIVTEADLHGGKWKKATIIKEIVKYTDLTIGSVAREKGYAGKWQRVGDTFVMEFASQIELLNQTIGELTSPTDRHRRPEDLGINMASFTFARTVSAVTDNRNFTVSGAAFANDYLQYGRLTFTSGANNGLSMEIKTNTGNALELQLPMRSTVANGDGVTLYAGYNGSREQARDKFSAMIAFNGEPDLPGPMAVLRYPED